jgi:hypothetical protein
MGSKQMDIPDKPAIELVLGAAIWALGRALWGIRFTRQWYDDVLKDQKHMQALVESAIQNAPLKELTRTMVAISSASGSQEGGVVEQFPAKIEDNLSETRQRFESRWQLLFAITFILILGSVALSPYVAVLNLCVALFLSRYVGFSNTSFRIRVFSDALIARAPAVELIMDWFNEDPSGCGEWCAVSHPEFQTAFAVIRSSASKSIK